MSKDSITDYLGFTVIKFIGPLIRILPLGFGLFLGRSFGRLFYSFSPKHRAVVYSNIKKAFGERLAPFEIKKVTRDFFLNFGQNLVEVFFIPIIDKDYLSKYVSVNGLFHIEEAFKGGKGVIILPIHEGSWEIANMFCANVFGAAYNMVVQDQRHPRLNNLLNAYRLRTGCKLIENKGQVRHLIEALKNNEAVSITVDQGGKDGVRVEFFGKDASMSSGAIKIALKYGAAIIPVFAHRVKGSYIHIDIRPPFKLIDTKNIEKDIQDNLENIARIFEEYVYQYPKEYLWLYKIWKYSQKRNILILSDQKAGHLRQSEALSELVRKYFSRKNISVNIDTVEVEFKKQFGRQAVALSSLLAGKRHCRGCTWCLKKFLSQDTYNKLIIRKPDIIISCGASLAPVNYILAGENSAKSFVIMRPSMPGIDKFDLAIIPQHDKPKPNENIVVTTAALNLVDDRYLLKSQELLSAYFKRSGVSIDEKKIVLGVLWGGDTKNFSISEEALTAITQNLNDFITKHNAELMLTTSRRTSRGNESLIKEAFSKNDYCKLLIIANEFNMPEAVGGILAFSKILLVSPESISMISEALSSRKYVVVLDLEGLGRKHRSFLSSLASSGYIYLAKPQNLIFTLEGILKSNPEIKILDDNRAIIEKLSRII